MVRNIDDVKAELRKITDSKPVHAVAGAGVLASRTLLELPWRLVQWTRENPPESLPGRANGYVQTARTNMNGYVQTARTNANGYVQTARTDGYVQAARTNMNGYVRTARTNANGYVQTARTDGYVQAARTNMNGYVQTARANANGYVQTARTRAADGYDKLAEHGKDALNGQPGSTESESTTPRKSATPSKGELNGKPRGKAPSSRTGNSN